MTCSRSCAAMRNVKRVPKWRFVSGEWNLGISLAEVPRLKNATVTVGALIFISGSLLSKDETLNVAK